MALIVKDQNMANFLLKKEGADPTLSDMAIA